jgi:hypothetical protein
MEKLGYLNFAAPLAGIYGTAGWRSTPVVNHWSKELMKSGVWLTDMDNSS